MKYLGVKIGKPRIGVFDFTGCEGCELQLVNKEETLPAFLSLVEIVNFREASSDKSDDYDIALVEGCISREDEVERLKKIRANATVLVALGSCACFGGVSRLKNKFSVQDVVKEVYGKDKVDTLKVRSINEVVPVELQIPGCPVSKAEVEAIVVNLVTGAEIKVPKFPICVECKQKLNTCMVNYGELCLGPITLAGCGAVCPTGKVGCWGCRGPAVDANFDSFMEIMLGKGYTKSQIQNKVDFFGAFSGVRKGTLTSGIQEGIQSFNALIGVAKHEN